MTSKQKSLQLARVLWSNARLSAAVCLSCIVSSLALAQSPAPDTTQLTLLSGAGPHAYVAGVAIDMPRGSHTYWKMPGDAGVPPVFAFGGSRNVRAARVLYPAPQRITEDGLEAFGYRDHVLFPVEVTPDDAAKPAELDVDVAYAVCNRICIPEHARATITLTAAGGTQALAVDAALADVPVPATPSQRADLAIVPEPGAAKPTWTLTWHGTPPVDDVFADAPEGFYFATRRTGPQTWRLVADQTLHAPGAMPVDVALTLARKTGSLVVTEKLDTRSAAR